MSSYDQVWHGALAGSPDMQKQPLPVNELHCAGLALDAAGCDVHNVSYADLLPRGVLRSVEALSRKATA